MGVGPRQSQGRPAGGPFRHGAIGMPAAKAQDSRRTVLRLGRYLIRERWLAAGILVMVLLSVGSALIGPLLIGRGIDSYVIPGDLAGLARLAVIMIAIYGFGAAAIWLENYWMVGLAQRTAVQMRRDLFAKLQRLPVRYFDTHAHGDTMSRLTNDMEQVANTLTSSVTQVVNSLLTVVGTLVMMVYLSPLLTVIGMTTLPLMAVVTKFVAARTRRYFGEQQADLGTLNGTIEETISGQRVVKVFQQEEAVLAKFDAENQRLRESGLRAQIFAGVVPPLMNVINNLNFTVLAAAGGWLALRGVITLGIIASFINYSRQFVRPISQLASQFNMLQAAIAGAERVFELIDEEPEPLDDGDAVEPDTIAGRVQFSGVCFAYDEAVPVLKDIDLDVAAGETIALVGPTGAGKTTIISLLLRFYDVSSGSITIDGEDIRHFSRSSLRRALGIVLQDTYLFSDSIRENIRYGRLDASNEEVEAAAKMAFAHNFITRLPQGYDTVLGEDGAGLSQGQRQLLSIARAVLADPAVLILDEATSSVDTRTEVEIQRAMIHLMQGRTCFVIAHRLSTIRDADRIVVIDGGRIVEQGSHAALLAAGGFYAELYMSQFQRSAS